MQPIELTPKALERRVKRYFDKTTQHYFAACAPGLEKMLSNDIALLPGASDLQTVDGGVEFSGLPSLIYQANLQLSTANRVLLRLYSFKASSYPELFNKTRTKRWEIFLGTEPHLSVNVTARSSRLHHTDHIAKTILDGINHYYQPFAHSFTQNVLAPLEIFVRIVDDRVTISLNTSGDLLHKRGNKLATVQAPLRSTLASALLRQLDLTRYPVILDPCCGSGTLLFESADILSKALPGRDRAFAFEHMPFFNSTFFSRLKTQPPHPALTTVLSGSDLNPKAIQAAQLNQSRDSRWQAISFSQQDACRLPNTWGTTGLIVANLPYGKRVTQNAQERVDFYRQFGNNLTTNFRGWDVLLLSNQTQLVKCMGLRLKHSYTFDNGGIRVYAFRGTLP